MLRIWNPPVAGTMATFSRAMTEQDVELFADLTGTWDPLYFDEEFAQTTSFGHTVVPGCALSGILEAESAWRFVGRGSVVTQQAWDYPAPVFVGDTVTVEARVAEVQPDNRITVLECVARRSDGTEVLRGGCRLYTAEQREQA